MTSFLRVTAFFLLLGASMTVGAPLLPAVARKPAPSPSVSNDGDFAVGVSYTISFVNLEQHLAHVQMILPAGRPTRELQFPVWNALYQIRDFSQYINWIRAKDRPAILYRCANWTKAAGKSTAQPVARSWNTKFTSTPRDRSEPISMRTTRS